MLVRSVHTRASSGKDKLQAVWDRLFQEHAETNQRTMRGSCGSAPRIVRSGRQGPIWVFFIAAYADLTWIGKLQFT